MGWFLRALDKADSFFSWWDRLAKLPWIASGVTTGTLYVAQLGAVFAGLPLVTQVTDVLGAAASVTLLFVYLPRLLLKMTNPTFTISVSRIVIRHWEDPALDNVRVEISILNRSPKHRAVFDIALYFRSQSGDKHWAQPINLTNMNLRLDRQGHTKGWGHFYMGPFADLIPPKSNELYLDTERSFTSKAVEGIYLNVMDHISGRRVEFRIPGAYP